MITTEESIIRLCIALVLGAVIGYERQAQNKSAGLRTHTLMCIGSCLCMIVSVNVAMSYYFGYGYHNSDPERIAAQVVSGVGFLGAGTILANQKARNVQGLTTAATIWVVAAVGLVTGAGYLAVAIVATVLIFLVLTVFIRVDTLLTERCRKYYILQVAMKNTVGQSRRMTAFFAEEKINVESFQALSGEEGPLAEFTVRISYIGRLQESDIIGKLLALKGVSKAEIVPEETKESAAGPQ